MAEKKETKDIKETDWDELVEIRLPKDRNNRDDLFVAVNDRTFLIQRGKTVKVPAYVAEVIRQSMEMDEEAITAAEEMSASFARETKARGL